MRSPYRCEGTVIDVSESDNTYTVTLARKHQVGIGDVLTDFKGNSGVVTEISNAIGGYDIVANFEFFGLIQKTQIAETLLEARSVGQYNLSGQPIADADGSNKPQMLSYFDILLLHSAGLSDVLQNMLLYQGKNHMPRTRLYEGMVKGKQVNELYVSSSEICKFVSYMAGICVKAEFTDENGKEIDFLSGSDSQIAPLLGKKISLRLREYTNEEIKNLSKGEVTTQNLFTVSNQIHQNGLLSERIFGTTKDWACNCVGFNGKKGTVCSKCGVEISHSSVRSKRFGHIMLEMPIEHPLVKGNFITYLPVIPPNHRPVLQMDNNLYLSELITLYQRVIERNNRLKKLIQLNADSSIIASEKALLADAVSELFYGRAMNQPNYLKPLLEHVKDLFNVNCFKEALDYSACCGICPDKTVAQNTCGLPFDIAIDLFKPLLMAELVRSGVSSNLRTAKKILAKNKKGLGEATYASVFKALSQVMSNQKIIVFCNSVERGLLVLTPQLTNLKVLTLCNKDYNRLKAEPNSKATILFPASTVGQSLLLSNNAKYVEKNQDIISELSSDFLYKNVDICFLLQRAIFNGASVLQTRVSRMMFGIPTEDAFKLYQMPAPEPIVINNQSDSENSKEKTSKILDEIAYSILHGINNNPNTDDLDFDDDFVLDEDLDLDDIFLDDLDLDDDLDDLDIDEDF